MLFDKAIHDIEHSRYEIGRLTLQTMINTYDSSEYLAKAKLAIADSWYKEGGARGLAQAEAEYKDFILFYPAMEESAEAQNRVCDIHYRQMEKTDRDNQHALRAQEECSQLLKQFPNSKFAPIAQQKLRDIQEVLGDAEYRVGAFYHTKGSFPASANRLQALVDQFPLYSQNDEALWTAADDYRRMGDRFENQEALAYTRIVRDYPLSPHVEESKARLQAMKRPVPEADPAALAARPRLGAGGGGGGGGANGLRNFRVSVRERSFPSSSSMNTSLAILGYSGSCGVMRSSVISGNGIFCCTCRHLVK